jgi:hypothetical protein
LEREGVHHLGRSEDFDAVAVLADDRARIAAHEGVASEVFAALDGFEEERFALAADLAIGGERGFEIGQQAAADGDQVSLGGQLHGIQVDCGPVKLKLCAHAALMQDRAGCDR